MEEIFSHNFFSEKCIVAHSTAQSTHLNVVTERHIHHSHITTIDVFTGSGNKETLQT